MSTQPPIPRAREPFPVPGAGHAGNDTRWMHDLRNELNTAMMSAAAARRLLQDGRTEEALVNLQRSESACYRCALLLSEPDDPA